MFEDLDITIPDEFIALHPKDKRDESRLMVLDRAQQTITHHIFHEITQFFKAGDVLVLNDSKVLPVRLVLQRESNAKIECLLLKEVRPKIWECLLSKSKRIKEDEVLLHDQGSFNGRVLKRLKDTFLISFEDVDDFLNCLLKWGEMPLPPYIKRNYNRDADLLRYQTVYAEKSGSAAAPTAGFHFSQQLLDQLKEMGVLLAPVTLHVGLGTFLPVRSPSIKEHQMHTEEYEISPESAKMINDVRRQGRRITAVGTTSVRTLESAFDGGELIAGSGKTDIFIYPPYEFKVVNRLITNFHQPDSTLILLVAALAGNKFIRTAYEEAMQNHYRFFSYGDAMLIG